MIFQSHKIFRGKFFKPDTFAPAGLCPFPEFQKFFKSHVIQRFFLTVINNQKRNPLLFFILLHKRNLMLVNILKRKCICGTLFCVKTNGNSLNSSDIIHGADLVKIGKCDMTPFLVNPNRSDRGRHLLDQRQSHFFIPGICVIDHIFQGRTTKSP